MTVSFSRSNPHDQRVPVLLTADEFLFARDEAERRGISLSAYFRQLLTQDRRAVAIGALSVNDRYEKSAEPAQEFTKAEVVSMAVQAALNAYERAGR